jgi:hypothetical protein
MTSQPLGIFAAALIAGLLCVVPADASGQVRAGAQARRAQPAQPGAPATAREVERLFDAYVVMQAQDVLRLTESQVGPFLSSLRDLQQGRRRHLVERRQMLATLKRLLAARRVDEGRIRDALGQLRERDQQAEEALTRAYAAIDQVLDVVQRARFRVLEDEVERRKIELLMRARRRVPVDPGTDRNH